jgi:phosphoenolpyruvate-protein kinase (PTS system EI component)
MKKKLSIGFALLLIAVALYFGLAPRELSDAVNVAPGPAAPQAVRVQEPEVPAAQEDPAVRRAAMESTFAGLDAARRELRQQLEQLKVAVWGREFPARQASAISHDMMLAERLLTNPPMLGAFHDTAAIARERERVAAALARLADIEREISNP